MKNVILLLMLAGTCFSQANAEVSGICAETQQANSVLRVSPSKDLGRELLRFVKKSDCRDVTVELEAGQTYDIPRLKIPELDKVTFVSAKDESGKKATLVTSTVSLTTSIEALAFKDVNVDGSNTRFLMAWDGDIYAKSLVFAGCDVKNVNQSILRIGKNAAGMSIKEIVFDNCILSEISTMGWGAVNISGDVASLERIAFTNSTLVNIGEQLVDLRRGIGRLDVENCTFYSAADAKKDLNRVFLLRNSGASPASPSALTVRNVIFAGGNAGKPMSAGLGNYSCLDFSDNNYITSDVQEGKVPFSGITKLDVSSGKFFANPKKGDFHIKAKFAGKGKAGDPRWY